MTRHGGRALVALTVFAALLLPAPTAHASTARPGGACTKVGATIKAKGVLLKCTKARGKKRWMRVPTAGGPASPAAGGSEASTPLAEMLATPLPNLAPSGAYAPVTASEGPASIEALLGSSLRVTTEVPANVTVNVDPRVRAEWARDQVSGVGTAFALAGALGLAPKGALRMSIGQDLTYLRPYLTNGWCGQVADDASMPGGGNCGDGNVWTNTAFWERQAGGQAYPYPDPSFDLWLNGNLPHEIIHSIQNDLVAAAAAGGRPDAWRTLAAWVREGGPEVYKVAVWGATKGLTYRQARQEYLSRAGQRCAEAHLSDLLSEQSTANACEYDYGMLATEYLIATTRDLTAPFWMLQRAQSTAFPAAFQEAYGIDFTTFSAAADEYVRAQYLMQR